MTLQQIKDAVNAGHKVHWSHDGYEVIKDNVGQWLILCSMNGHAIGLYGKNEKLNGKEDDFFIKGGR